MLVTLIVLYVGSQLVSTVMSTVSADKTQKYIMYGLPFFFVVFVFQFPAGLLLYWITTNLWTIVQQLIVRKRLGPLRPPRRPGRPAGAVVHGADPRPAGDAAPRARPTPCEPPWPARRAQGPADRARRPPPPRKKKKRSGRRR